MPRGIRLVVPALALVAGCRRDAPGESLIPTLDGPPPPPARPALGFQVPDVVPYVAWSEAAEAQEEALTVEPARGLAWERDPDWKLDGYSVPHAWALPDGTFGLSVTNNNADYDDHPRWRADGDGRRWSTPREGWWPADFDPACGEFLTDMAVRVDPTGEPDYVFVGQTGLESELCWLPGDAAREAGATGGPFVVEGFDEESFGVPAFLMLPDGRALFYFILAEADVGGLYVARVERGATYAVPAGDGPILATGNIDPMPMHLSDGGVRLYHTVGDEYGAYGIGYTDLADGITAAAAPTVLVPSTGECTKEPTGECLVDPAVLRLPDGGLVMYFGAIDYGPDGTAFNPSIQRAFAVD